MSDRFAFKITYCTFSTIGYFNLSRSVFSAVCVYMNILALFFVPSKSKSYLQTQIKPFWSFIDSISWLKMPSREGCRVFMGNLPNDVRERDVERWYNFFSFNCDWTLILMIYCLLADFLIVTEGFGTFSSRTANTDFV